MGVDAEALKHKAKNLASAFTTMQKVAIVGAGVAVIVAILVVTRMGGGSSSTAALYTDLAPEDAAAVTEQLTSVGASYTLADGGSTIMVTSDQLYDLRLQMAAEGLPSRSDGYALLDQQGLTASEFSQQVGYQRAMEGEIARTIQAMDNVDSAIVHLVIPSQDVFASDEEEASASVLVKAKPSQDLDSGQIQSVVHLVASSVRNLDPTNVTVTDAAGNLLAAPGVEGMTSAGLDNHDGQRIAYQDQVARSILDLVEPVVGVGNAKVTVTADLDFDKKSVTSESYSQPSENVDQPTPKVDSTKTETYTGPGGATTGVLGPDGTPAAGAGTATDYSLEQSNTEYALDTTVETVESAPGMVRRLGVAMAVNSDAASPQVVDQLQSLVASGALVDTERGDTIEVSRVEFDTTTAEANQKALDEAASAESRKALLGLVQKVVVALLLLAVAFFVWRALRKANQRNDQLVAAAGAVREVTARAVSSEAGTEPPALPATPVLAPIKTEDELRRDAVSLEVADLIDRQPSDVAQLLRTWLGDRRSVKR
jgi:flagellar M-ring protein FliF